MNLDSGDNEAEYKNQNSPCCTSELSPLFMAINACLEDIFKSIEGNHTIVDKWIEGNEVQCKNHKGITLCILLIEIIISLFTLLLDIYMYR